MKQSQSLIIVFVMVLFKAHHLLASTGYLLENSQIEYTVKYTFKTVKGKSDKARGKGICDSSLCQFLVATPITSFNSGDRNRDLKTLELTRAAIHPLTKMTLSIPESTIQKDFKGDIEVELSGRKSTVKKVTFKVETKEGKKLVSTQFNINLSDFEIERPKLLTIPIDDKVGIDIKSTWVEK